MMMMSWMVIVLGAYLIGSCPFGFLITKLMRGGDIRHAGSGNIGATNVMRHLGKKAGYLTFVLDSSKGMLALWVCCMVQPLQSMEEYYYVGLVAVIGHCFPVWLRFKGGKGVSTALGVIAYAQLATHPDAWWVLVCVGVVWIGAFMGMRMVSVASLLTFIAAPLVVGGMYGVWLAPCCLSALVIARHHGNIRRLLAGTEHRFVKKK